MHDHEPLQTSYSFLLLVPAVARETNFAIANTVPRYRYNLSVIELNILEEICSSCPTQLTSIISNSAEEYMDVLTWRVHKQTGHSATVQLFCARGLLTVGACCRDFRRASCKL